MKERLVGAAVLVAIGAWLIPWVLDGSQRVTAPQSAALELPAPAAENPPMRTETVVLDRRDSPMARESESPSEPVPRASGETPVARPATAPASHDRPGAAAEPPPAQTAAVTTEKSPAAEPTAAAAGETRWYAQLGAFGDQANADRLAARVGTYGYQAHVSGFPSSGRTVHRVRVGPEPSRARAEAIASALSAHGFVAQVVFE